VLLGLGKILQRGPDGGSDGASIPVHATSQEFVEVDCLVFFSDFRDYECSGLVVTDPITFDWVFQSWYGVYADAHPFTYPFHLYHLPTSFFSAYHEYGGPVHHHP